MENLRRQVDKRFYLEGEKLKVLRITVPCPECDGTGVVDLTPEMKARLLKDGGHGSTQQ